MSCLFMSSEERWVQSAASPTYKQSKSKLWIITPFSGKIGIFITIEMWTLRLCDKGRLKKNCMIKGDNSLHEWGWYDWGSAELGLRPLSSCLGDIGHYSDDAAWVVCPLHFSKPEAKILIYQKVKKHTMYWRILIPFDFTLSDFHVQYCSFPQECGYQD